MELEDLEEMEYDDVIKANNTRNKPTLTAGGGRENISDSEDEKEFIGPLSIENPGDPTPTMEKKNPYPYGIHEVHASLWCNESLLQHLIAIMKMFEHQPQGLQELVTICWEDIQRDLTECVFDIMQQVVDHIQDRFQRSEAFLFKLYIDEVVQS